ncbi:ArsR family transcriptional regulator [Salinadaptatus halalkaliphilus]|uniref:ArsR family transcriptional regulator n=1 Tax=Salinadaptatus halalkaliphilus TaxID=2419781 RepID=A0A4V3VKT6_9EURY|nr:ArsR family transcriptional regulator [Salinadaptatus halalkaliphilus]THE62997.1 ArsR family transcriptional regulator [Salinadaptatus halalkaliphilus]
MSVQTRRSDSLAESEVFHILGNDRRRAIVQLLAQESGQIDVSDVANEIAATESDTTPVPNNLYKSVYVSLQQTHLPQLEEDAVIEYDSEAKTISPGPNFDDVITYINGHSEDQSQLLQLHLVACVLGLALIAIAGLNLPLLSSVDPVLWSVLVLLVVAASSLYQLLA